MYIQYCCIHFTLLGKVRVLRQQPLSGSQFCGSEVPAWPDWVLGSGSQEAEIKTSPGLGCRLDSGRENAPWAGSVVGGIQPFRAVDPWLSARGCSKLPRPLSAPTLLPHRCLRVCARHGMLYPFHAWLLSDFLFCNKPEETAFTGTLWGV